MSYKEKIKEELQKLAEEGQWIYYHEAYVEKKITEDDVEKLLENPKFKEYIKKYQSFRLSYQSWYSKCLPVIKQVLPDRLDEFISYYKNEKRKELSYLTYTINDYLLDVNVTRGGSVAVNSFGAFSSKMDNQITIISSAVDRIESLVSDIRNILQSELFDNELEASKDLLKKKFLRASGMLAGVTLETHLGKVCENHLLKFRKKNPTISDFNEELKKSEITDIPTWRLIQRLGDIRNLCAHPKEREPKVDEIEDLIRGTEKLIAELI
jgi:hypothetical protein